MYGREEEGGGPELLESGEPGDDLVFVEEVT
jgi:hypothetical protein